MAFLESRDLSVLSRYQAFRSPHLRTNNYENDGIDKLIGFTGIQNSSICWSCANICRRQIYVKREKNSARNFYHPSSTNVDKLVGGRILLEVEAEALTDTIL